MADKSQNFERFLNRAESANVVPVVETLPADLLTPLAVYLKISLNATDSFLLESVEGGESLGRYSFIGANPEMIVSGGEIQTSVQKNNQTKTYKTSLFDFLREYFSSNKLSPDADLPVFGGGAIGFFDFSCAAWFEKTLKRNQAETNNARLMFFRQIVAFDHAKQVIKIIRLVFTDEAKNEEELEKLYEKAITENEKLKEILETQSIVLPKPKAQDSISKDVKSNWNRDDFEKAVDKIKELISAGECYQVVLSQRFTRKTNADAISIYRALRSLNPSPYMFLLQTGEQSIVGASPEMLVKCINGTLEYRPIAWNAPARKIGGRRRVFSGRNAKR
jgi:anthranilate synthase component 1